MANRPYVIGYYADWQTSLPPSKIDYRLFTHLNHAFARIDKQGVLRFPDPANTQDLCARAHTAGVKVLLSVGGADTGTGFANATTTPDAVKRLADQLADVVQPTGYDGIDLDWEFPANAAERDRMNALTAALRERLPRPALLTMAVPATNWSGRWFGKDALLPHIDFLNVMTYDFHGSWSDHAGHNAPLFFPASGDQPSCRGNTVEGSMDYWLRQKNWPKDRLLLGIPLYGRGFRAPRLGAPASGTHARSGVPYRGIEALRKLGWRETWDDVAQVPWLQAPDESEVLCFDDARSIRRKGRYARERGLAGIFFWEVSEDFDGTSNPLVKAASDGLKS
jgi:chitinase